MKQDWDGVAFILGIVAVFIAIIGAVTYYNAYFPAVMARQGMCEVFKDPPHSWVWEKCK